MNVNQLKTRVFVFKSIDTILVLGLIGAAAYTALYSDNKETMLIACLVGLYLVNTLGRYTSQKVAKMKNEIKKLEREKKQEEQRKMMKNRHSVAR